MEPTEFRAFGNFDKVPVVAVVTDLEEFINAPPDSDIIVYVELDGEETPTNVRKGDVNWTNVEGVE